MVFLENELLYGTAFPMSDEAMSEDFLIPIGKAKIERQGDHVTLVTFSKATQLCMEAAQELETTNGVHCEVQSTETAHNMFYTVWYSDIPDFLYTGL